MSENVTKAKPRGLSVSRSLGRYTSVISPNFSKALCRQRRRDASAPAPSAGDASVASVAVVHGDVDSLAGWGLGVEVLEPLDAALREQLGCGAQHVTPRSRLRAWFAEAAVCGILSTHTCLPFGQALPWGEEDEAAAAAAAAADAADADADVDGGGGGGGARVAGPRVLFNNGSAGMPNFRGGPAGVERAVRSLSEHSAPRACLVAPRAQLASAHPGA